MTPRWITAFIDQPAGAFDRGTRFWAEVTGSSISATRGEHDEFATLVPVTGHAFCRVQRTADDSAGIHVDFHVDAIADARVAAEALGAILVEDRGHVLMRSPGGLSFCFVEHHGEQVVPLPVGDPPAALDQVCVDIPDDRFDHELRFWSELFGWADVPLARAEFHRLAQPGGLPLELLFQRLGAESPATRVVAHLDLAAGDDREAVAARHVELGATRIATFDRWIVLRDPVGLDYCVTGRSPRV